MVAAVPAVYEHGVLRPLEPVDLEEGERVTLTVARPAALESGKSAHAILGHIASLAVTREGDGFSGEHHDDALYGGGAAP